MGEEGQEDKGEGKKSDNNAEEEWEEIKPLRAEIKESYTNRKSHILFKKLTNLYKFFYNHMTIFSYNHISMNYFCKN